MTKEVLKFSIDELLKEMEQRKNIYIKEYCKFHNPYKVGDFFTDHIGTIIIEKISYYISQTNPCCIYFGTELKADGKPRKDKRKRTAFQSNENKTKNK